MLAIGLTSFALPTAGRQEKCCTKIHQWHAENSRLWLCVLEQTYSLKSSLNSCNWCRYHRQTDQKQSLSSAVPNLSKDRRKTQRQTDGMLSAFSNSVRDFMCVAVVPLIGVCLQYRMSVLVKLDRCMNMNRYSCMTCPTILPIFCLSAGTADTHACTCQQA